MNIKEQENQLSFTLKFEIILTIFIWTLLVGFMSYRLWMRSLPHEPGLSIMNNVPSIKQQNIDILRASLKPISQSNLPVVRLEPFD